MNKEVGTEIEGVKVNRFEFFPDTRGRFIKIYPLRASQESEPYIAITFNPIKGTIRGLHFQVEPHAEEKLVTCIQGSIFDVIVDLRSESKTYGSGMSVELSAENSLQIYWPKGVAHGFQTLEANSIVHYSLLGTYSSELACTIDPFGELDISWPIDEHLVSQSDINGISFALAAQMYEDSLKN